MNGTGVTRSHGKRRIMAVTSEVSELVTVSFHNVPASLLQEFAQKIVGPYFDGDMNEALRRLLDDALLEEEFFQTHVDKRRVIFEKR
jgi:hypothetical protein